MYFGKKPSPLTVTEKRIKRNPKYSHVKGHLDTGASISKVKLVSTKEFLKRRSEIFQRIRAADVARLISSHFAFTYPNPNTIIDEEKPELEETIGDSVSSEQDSESLLLLDMRTRQEYETCHIKQSKHFSIVRLHQDRLIPELYRFKNAENKMIVVYDDDEKLAAEAATSLNQKGYDNIRLMSGGLRVFGNMYPERLAGDLPEKLLHQEQRLVNTARSSTCRRSVYSPRDGNSTYAPSVISSTHSVRTHRSSFSRASRWKDDESDIRRHREILRKVHGQSPDCL